MNTPRRFFTGRQVLEFYIPNYGKEDEIPTVDQEVEHSVTNIMNKINLRETLPSVQQSKTKTSENHQTKPV